MTRTKFPANGEAKKPSSDAVTLEELELAAVHIRDLYATELLGKPFDHLNAVEREKFLKFLRIMESQRE